MRPRSLRGAATLAAGALAVPLVVAVATPAPALADDSSTITVVGTSDVSDSGLMASVIKPGFEAYEKSLGKSVTLTYVPQGTGAAIKYAEQGTASALIVHAASLENSFVAQGYSLEPAGRAFTWGDYVLLGPARSDNPSYDPAGILGSDGSPSHDIVGAYEKVAAAGANGNAQFVSRGGTPGTTVQEHAIWALTNGVGTCQVSTTNGGGTVPSTTNVGAPCPSTATNPSWYTTTGKNQGDNVTAADVCSYSASGNCYVFTDKGTFENLRANGGSAVSNLKIVAENNDVPGQENLLINSFHAYGINPSAFSSSVAAGINTDAAHDLLTWLTSPAGQTAIANYLASDPDGAPFRPSAAPTLTVTPSSAAGTSVAAGTPITFSGSLVNQVPGTPALGDVTISLQARPTTSPSATPTTVATAVTRSDGSYVISYTPKTGEFYTVTSPQIQQVENASLSPVFEDLLQPTSAGVGTIGVTGVVSSFAARDKAATKAHDVLLGGSLAPTAPAGSQLVLYAAKAGSSSYTRKASKAIAAGTSTFRIALPLAKGSWRVRLYYVAPGLRNGVSGTVPVTIT